MFDELSALGNEIDTLSRRIQIVSYLCSGEFGNDLSLWDLTSEEFEIEITHYVYDYLLDTGFAAKQNFVAEVNAAAEDQQGKTEQLKQQIIDDVMKIYGEPGEENAQCIDKTRATELITEVILLFQKIQLMPDDDSVDVFAQPPAIIDQPSATAAVSETERERKDITEKLDYLRALPQPAQRTKEWYTCRHNMISASSAHKALGTQAAANSLIYEKCCPPSVENEEDSATNCIPNMAGPREWGHRYEHVSVMLYEQIYQTKIEEFGCIQHPVHTFLGASPDGINVDPKSPRYGRLLEIKNVISREITGIPKPEYYTQVQLQEEVCDIDECDFLETKFREYSCRQEYLDDTDATTDAAATERNMNTHAGHRKGIIIAFVCRPENDPAAAPQTKPGLTPQTMFCQPTKPKLKYEYLPITICTQDAADAWCYATIDRAETEGYDFIKYFYWRLEIFSCVLIERNTAWFARNLPKFRAVWDIVLYERVHGYEHRAPVRRAISRAASGAKSTAGISMTNIINNDVCFIPRMSHAASVPTATSNVKIVKLGANLAPSEPFQVTLKF